MDRDNRLTTLLVGIGIGAAAALLFAPCSGADFRKGIRKRADDAGADLKEQAEALANRVETVVDAVHDRVGSELAKGKDAARDISNIAKNAIETAAGVATNATGEMLDRARVLGKRFS